MLRTLVSGATGRAFLEGQATGGAPTTSATRAFQTENDLAADGIAGPLTRARLFEAYMLHLATDDATGEAFVLDAKQDFLGRGADADGKADFQGCGEHNPLLVFSEEETQDLARPENKPRRDAENSTNRRVLAFFFEKGSRASVGAWPCPRAGETPSACKARFFSDAAARVAPRSPGAPPRDPQLGGTNLRLRRPSHPRHDGLPFLPPLRAALACEVSASSRWSYPILNARARTDAGCAYVLQVGDPASKVTEAEECSSSAGARGLDRRSPDRGRRLGGGSRLPHHDPVDTSLAQNPLRQPGLRRSQPHPMQARSGRGARSPRRRLLQDSSIGAQPAASWTAHQDEAKHHPPQLTAIGGSGVAGAATVAVGGHVPCESRADRGARAQGGHQPAWVSNTETQADWSSQDCHVQPSSATSRPSILARVGSAFTSCSRYTPSPWEGLRGSLLSSSRRRSAGRQRSPARRCQANHAARMISRATQSANRQTAEVGRATTQHLAVLRTKNTPSAVFFAHRDPPVSSP